MARGNGNARSAKSERRPTPCAVTPTAPDRLKIWAVDTEDDTKGKVTIVDFYDGKDHYTFTARSETEDLRYVAYNFIRGTIRKGKVWAVNAKYDMGNLLPSFESATEIVYRGGNFVYCRIGGVYLSDINRHIFASVKTLGDLLGLPKLETELTEGETPARGSYEWDRWITRCRRDTEITWRAALWIHDYYEHLGTDVKCTLPSSAIRLYQNKYKRIYVPRLEMETLNWARQAYSGGRVEAFRIGKIEGPIFYVDVNSMFPSVMLKAYPDLKTLRSGPNLDFEGITEADVSCDMFYPVLWHRTKDKLLFPRGRFRGVWPNNELRYFQRQGGKILRVRSGMHTLSVCYPFQEYVTDLYERRLKSKSGIESTMLKLFLNSLYGKFGQDRTSAEFRKVHRDTLRDATYVYFVLAEEGDYKFIYRQIERKTYPPTTNYFWPAYVTGYARIKLHKKITDIDSEGGEPLYCDTDSVIFRGGVSPVETNGLGEWSAKDVALSCEIIAPKTYSLHYHGHTAYKAKGIPNRVAAQAFATGSAEWDAPLQMREALRRSLPVNLWIKKQRRLLQEYNKRRVLTDGSTEPLVV